MRWYLILLLGLGDCHHLDEVADGVLSVDRGAAAALEAPLHGAAVYHWKKWKGRVSWIEMSRGHLEDGLTTSTVGLCTLLTQKGHLLN